MADSSAIARLKKLDAEREKLLSTAKAEALANAKAAIAELNSLGFNYRLAEGDRPATRTPRALSTGTRRAGIRDQIVAAVKASGNGGLNRAALLAKLGLKGNKSGEQSVSNALSALKKSGTLAAKDGSYTVA